MGEVAVRLIPLGGRFLLIVINMLLASHEVTFGPKTTKTTVCQVIKSPFVFRWQESQHKMKWGVVISEPRYFLNVTVC